MDDHNWLDITVPIHDGMTHWQGDPPVRVERLSAIENGDSCNMTALTLTAHTGTHLDAPLHFLQSGCSMDSMSPSLMAGQARVLSIGNTKRICIEQLHGMSIHPHDRILFKTANSQTPWWTEPFRTDFVHLTPSAARHLADMNVELVGIDYLSIGAPDDQGAETHRILAQAGIWVLEGLYLKDASPGQYELLCLPLRIQAAEGAPCRALIRPCSSRRNVS